MANVQKYFEQFNTAIKLDRFDENEDLRDKRDKVKRKIEDRLPGVFESHKESRPKWEFFDQGSYKMGTGIKPIDGGELDIDQGMHFAISSADFADPVLLKKRVHEAVDGHTKEVRIRNSCVTVFYQEDGEHTFHVDVAIYADGSLEPDSKPRLAKGKENSDAEHRFWEISKPQELADAVLAGFSEEKERKQFRRLVRYLKRWRDERFHEGGNSAPIGLALTILVLNNLAPKIGFDGRPDDLEALEDVVNSILSQFTVTWDSDNMEFVDRLKVELPVEPWSDLLENMSNRQMKTFKEKLETLRDSLKYARDEVDPREACIELHKRFGRDFPIPEPKDTAKATAPAIVSSSSSA